MSNARNLANLLGTATTIQTAKIADDAVTTAKLPNDAVTSAKIADGTIATGNIADDAVTTAKLPDDAVTSAKIADGTIATGNIADDAVTGAKIENSPSIADGLTLSDGDLVFASGHGISFAATGDSSGGSMANELLDDYEQGDFVPSFTVASGSVTFDSSRKTLCYTKIGRKVTIIGQLKVSSVSGPSGIFRASLPFTRGNQTEQAERTVGTIVVTGAAVNNANEFTTYPDGDTSSYLEICSTSGTTINRNGGQNMQAGAFIYVNYTYFTA